MDRINLAQDTDEWRMLWIRSGCIKRGDFFELVRDYQLVEEVDAYAGDSCVARVTFSNLPLLACRLTVSLQTGACVWGGGLVVLPPPGGGGVESKGVQNKYFKKLIFCAKQILKLLSQIQGNSVNK